MSYDSTGVACCHAVGGNVTTDYTACTDDSARANGDPWTDGDIAAKPAVLANGYGVGRLYGLPTETIVDGVLRSVERAVGSQEGVGTDGDVGCVEQGAVVVDEHALAKMQSVAVVTMERRKYGD